MVIADIGLPRLDGFGVAQQLRSAGTAGGHRIYLVALTGHGDPEQRERALSSGFDVHLVKPVEPDVLARLLSDSVIHSAQRAAPEFPAPERRPGSGESDGRVKLFGELQPALAGTPPRSA